MGGFGERENWVFLLTLDTVIRRKFPGRYSFKSTPMKTFLRISGFAVLLFVILALRPIMNPSLEKSDLVMGTLTGVLETNTPGGDVFLKLAEDDRRFYINRGVENGVSPETWKKEFTGKPVKLYYARHWTPLDPFGSTKHVTRVELKEEVLYSEF